MEACWLGKLAGQWVPGSLCLCDSCFSNLAISLALLKIFSAICCLYFFLSWHFCYAKHFNFKCTHSFIWSLNFWDSSTVYSWLVWNLLYRPRGHQTQKSPCLFFQSAGSKNLSYAFFCTFIRGNHSCFILIFVLWFFKFKYILILNLNIFWLNMFFPSSKSFQIFSPPLLT